MTAVEGLDRATTCFRYVPYCIIVLISIVLALSMSLVASNNEDLYSNSIQGNSHHIVDNDQYAHLADSLLKGHLYLDLPVDEGLAALANPYDCQVRKDLIDRDGATIYWDYAYKDGHYYCYFGVVPAILLYVPYRAITGRSLSTPIAVLILGALSVVAFAVLSFLAMKALYRNRIGNFNLVCGFVALLLGGNIFCHIGLARFYSVPVLCSLLLTASGFSFWMYSKLQFNYLDNVLRRKSGDNLAVKRAYIRRANIGLALGSYLLCLNFGARPQFILTCFLAFPLFWKEIKGKLLFSRDNASGTAGVLLAIAFSLFPLFAYNYLRFGSFLDMGSYYNLTGFDMTSYDQDWKTTFKLVYYYLFQPVNYGSAFPFIETIAMTFPGWTPNEPMFGGLFFFEPLAMLALCAVVLIGKKGKQYSAFTIMSVVFSVLVLFVDARSAGITQRYFSDFGWYIFVGVALAIWEVDSCPSERRAVKTIFRVFVVVLIAISVINVACVAFSPVRYDSIAVSNPALYQSFASFFSS